MWVIKPYMIKKPVSDFKRKLIPTVFSFIRHRSLHPETYLAEYVEFERHHIKTEEQLNDVYNELLGAIQNAVDEYFEMYEMYFFRAIIERRNFVTERNLIRKSINDDIVVSYLFDDSISDDDFCIYYYNAVIIILEERIGEYWICDTVFSFESFKESSFFKKIAWFFKN